MSQIRTSSLALGLLLSLLFLALAGCGDKNSQAVLDPVAGKHAASDWLPAGHVKAANSSLDSCNACHGSDFTGGISKVACTQCHLGNQQEVHPVLWGQYAYALHGGYAKKSGTAACANISCHGNSLTGVTGSGPSCSSCHMGGLASAHIVGWNSASDFSSPTPLHAQYVGANGTTTCRSAVCHGVNLKGVFLSGPSCNACHNSF